MFDFKNKVVVVTGAAQGIGKCIKESFENAGANVCIIDVQDNEYFKGDISTIPSRYRPTILNSLPLKTASVSTNGLKDISSGDVPLEQAVRTENKVNAEKMIDSNLLNMKITTFHTKINVVLYILYHIFVISQY